MAIIIQRPGGIKLLLQTANAAPFPSATVEPLNVDVFYHYKGEDQVSNYLGTFPVGKEISVPFSADLDRDVVVTTVARGPLGQPHVNDIRDAPSIVVQSEREQRKPVIGQMGTSSNLRAIIGVSFFPRHMHTRRVQIATDLAFTNIIAEWYQDIDRSGKETPRMSEQFSIERVVPGLTPLTYYVRVAHSSFSTSTATELTYQSQLEGLRWGPDSDVLAVTLADGLGAGGSTGSFNPFQATFQGYGTSAADVGFNVPMPGDGASGGLLSGLPTRVPYFRTFELTETDQYFDYDKTHQILRTGGGFSGTTSAVNIQTDFKASGQDETTTGSITSGTNQLTVGAVGNFRQGDGIAIAGAGASGAKLVTTINSIIGSILTLAANASTTVAGAVVKHDDTAKLIAAIAAMPDGGRLFIPDGNFRVTSTITVNKRIMIVGNGPRSCITLDVGTGADGLVFDMGGGGYIEGIILRDFAVVGDAGACRDAVVMRNLDRADVRCLYIAAGTHSNGWALRAEGVLISTFNVYATSSFYYPFNFGAPSNGILLTGSAIAPSNANLLDNCIVEVAAGGKCLFIDGSTGTAGTFNNWVIGGTYEGASDPGIWMKNCSDFCIQSCHVEDTLGLFTTQGIRIENSGPGFVGNGIECTYLDLIASTDIKIDGVTTDRITIDSASKRNLLGLVRYNLTGSGTITDNGENTIYSGQMTASGLTAYQTGPAPAQTAINLLRNGGCEVWDADGPLDWDNNTAATMTKCGVGQVDTRKLFGEFCVKVPSGTQYTWANINSDDFPKIKGQFVTLTVWIYIPSGQAVTPNVSLRAWFDVGTLDYGLAGVTTTDTWIKRTMTVRVPASGSSSMQMTLVNFAAAAAGFYYLDGASVSIGRAGHPTEAPRIPRGLYLDLGTEASKRLRLVAHQGMAADIDLTGPTALPGAERGLTVDATGQMAYKNFTEISGGATDYFPFFSNSTTITASGSPISNFSGTLLLASGLLLNPDNTYDCGGASDNRFRDIHAARRFCAPDGSASAGAYTRAGQPGTNMYFNSDGVNFAVANNREVLIAGNNLQFGLSQTSANTFDLAVSSDTNKPRLRYNGATSRWRLTNDGTTFFDIPTTSGANLALSNLASVAINTTLVSDTANTDDLGTSAIPWKDAHLGGKVYFYEAPVNGTNYVSVEAPAALAANLGLKLPPADGAAGQSLKTDGAGNTSFGHPELVSGQTVLGSNFTLASAAGTYDDTGLSISLPAAGTYLITADVRGLLVVATGAPGTITAKLYNSTDSADVSNSERLVLIAPTTGTNCQGTSAIHAIVTVAAAKTIKLYAKRDDAGSFTTSLIVSDGGGRTTLGYVRIA